MLEVNIRVFRSAANNGGVRIERTVTEVLQRFGINKAFKLIEFHDFDLLNFVRRAEPVKEVDKR